MRYILQIFTGGWDTLNYTTEEILNRLKSLIPRMDVEKVILGWYPDAALYRPIGEYLRENNIDMLLWLPVFAELSEDPAQEHGLYRVCREENDYGVSLRRVPSQAAE